MEERCSPQTHRACVIWILPPIVLPCRYPAIHAISVYCKGFLEAFWLIWVLAVLGGCGSPWECMRLVPISWRTAIRGIRHNVSILLYSLRQGNCRWKSVTTAANQILQLFSHAPCTMSAQGDW